MLLFIQAVLVITYVAGTFCQKITFDNTDVGGITVGRFYIDGTIGENVTQLMLQSWNPFINIQVKKINAPAFAFMCAFAISGHTCTGTEICQCVYNTTTDSVHFVVNGTAGQDLYNAIIRAEWQHPTLNSVYSNKNYTVPGPHEETTTTTESSSPSSNITEETTTTTESSSPSSNITAPPESGPRDIVKIVCLSVIIPVVVIALVIGIVWYFKAKSKRSKAVTNNGTDTTDKREQPKPDRHNSEYTNHGYDETGTSPISVTIDEENTAKNNKLQQHNSDKKDVKDSHAKDKTNDGSASQTVHGEQRRLPPLKDTNIRGQLQPTGQPRPTSVEITSQTVKHNN